MRVRFEADKFVVPSELDRKSPDHRRLAVRAISLKVVDPSFTKTLLPVESARESFHREGERMVGRVSLKEEKVLQVPQLYYPGMLDVRVDGEPASYLAVPYKRYLLAGLKLPAGEHRISSAFVGLRWANLLSLAAWGLWSSLVFWAVRRRKKRVIRGAAA
jgi:hypothetical protein